MWQHGPSSRCIVSQLNSLLYQLHTVSFLLSPRLWAYFCRVLVQFQFSRPRDIDPQRSLRFWIFCILSTNVPSIYNHAAKSPAAGRSLILDFVGLGMLRSASPARPHCSQRCFLQTASPQGPSSCYLTSSLYSCRLSSLRSRTKRHSRATCRPIPWTPFNPTRYPRRLYLPSHGATATPNPPTQHRMRARRSIS